ncbi:MAG: UBP-type zinc finger domain-containing protein [Propionibacteriaceae bacterium]
MTDETTTTGIATATPPSGPGCVECDAESGWWFHLRRCAQCGHVGCCDSSPAQHATAHFRATGHPWMQSYEPGEDWFYNFADEQIDDGPELAGPASHPADQSAPGPDDRVPPGWQRHLH